MGGVCGAVSRREPEAIMRLHQRFPFRQQGGPFRVCRRLRDPASRLRGHAAPVLSCGQAAQGQPRRCRLSTSAVPSSADWSARAVSSCRRMSASRCSRSAMTSANSDACEARESSRRRADGAMNSPALSAICAPWRWGDAASGSKHGRCQTRTSLARAHERRLARRATASMSSARSATVTYQRGRHAVLPGQLGGGNTGAPGWLSGRTSNRRRRPAAGCRFVQPP